VICPYKIKECIKIRDISVHWVSGKVYAKCLEKGCSEIIEDARHSFRPGSSNSDKSFTLQQIFETSWENAKNIYSCFVDLKKHTTGSVEKSFEVFCKSTALTAACYWQLSHSIPAQKFVSVPSGVQKLGDARGNCLMYAPY